METSQNQALVLRLLDEPNKKISRKEFAVGGIRSCSDRPRQSPWQGRQVQTAQSSETLTTIPAAGLPQNPSEPGITSPCEQAIHQKRALSALNLYKST